MIKGHPEELLAPKYLFASNDSKIIYINAFILQKMLKVPLIILFFKLKFKIGPRDAHQQPDTYSEFSELWHLRSWLASRAKTGEKKPPKNQGSDFKFSILGQYTIVSVQ